MTKRDRATGENRPSTGQKIWQAFCRLMTSIFYRRHEAAGSEHVPGDGATILCANHVNALVDAVVIQATCERAIHPLARSGLFRRPLLRPILNGIQAVPIYRRQSGTDREVRQANLDAFSRCYEILGEGKALLIFPEGQSHSDPMLRPLKTGAARLALGHLERCGALPAVVPVGLNFSHKGRFRTSLLVQYGEPLAFEPQVDEDPEAQVRRYTAEIERGLERVTLNVDSWRDLELLRHLQSFFNLRGRRGQKSLADRFRVLKQLIDAHRQLRARFPDEVEALAGKLERFKELCDKHGVQDYHLNLRYRPMLVLRFLVRSLFFIGLVFPIALWGVLNSLLPYALTRRASQMTARGRDQYDTAGMLFGFLSFALFWGLQSFVVFWFWGLWPAATLYALSLPFSGAIALMVSRERMRILENVRVFLLFTRRRRLRDYLRRKREELEIDLARMTRLARQLATR